MNTRRFSKDLKAGDLIVISYGNYLRHAIWSGIGKSGTSQFYLLPWYDGNSWKNDHRVVNRISTGKKPLKDYMIRPPDTCIAKLSPDLLDDQDRENYTEMVALLLKHGYL